MSRQPLLEALNNLKRRQNDPRLSWTLNGLDDWTTEAIFAKLRELGVDTDAGRFVEQARAAGSFQALADQWLNQFPADKRESLWGDFPWMSVDVLWPRLAGDVVCADLIEHRLYTVLSSEEDDNVPADVNGLPTPGYGLPARWAAAMELMRFLESFSPAERAEKFKQVDKDGGYYDYSQWLLQLIWEEGADHVTEAMHIADVMTDCSRPAEFQGQLASVLVAAKQNDEAIARAEQNLQRFGDDPWSRILSGDVFAQVGDPNRALQLWNEAMPMVRTTSLWDTIADRIKDLLRDEKREDELEVILAAHPRPPEEKKAAARDIPPDESEMDLPALPGSDDNEPSAQLTRAKTIGRNDPCPCGSGKKYKKCCMP